MSRSIVLDARTATDHFPGIGRYVTNLARAMASLPGPDEHLILLRDPTQPSSWDLKTLAGGRVRVIDVPTSPFSLRQQWVIPHLLRHLAAVDSGRLAARSPLVFHSPYYLMPYRPGVPTVVTVYDLIPLLFPGYVSMWARWLFRWAMALALRTATRVIAISQSTRQDLLAAFRLAPDKVTVIPLAPDSAFAPCPPAQVEALRHRYNLPESFVLYLGSNKPHKNLIRLIEAWAQITEHGRRITLVLAGVWDPRYPESRQLAEQLSLQNVRWLGPVPEADLPALYSGATLFVFPSEYEGFGLPVLEAMACGTPVICANTSSLPEVAGDAALLVDPHSVDALAGAIEQVIGDAELRQVMREKGLAQAARFSWEHTARATWAIYQEMARNR